METTRENRVSTFVPPGIVMIVQHAIGKCGRNTIHTDVFKMSHINNKNGTRKLVDIMDEFRKNNGSSCKAQ